MTVDEAKHKMDYLKKAYQKLLDEKVDSGKLVGDGVMGEWKAETPIDEAYKSMIEALEIAIKALEQTEQTRWIPISEKLPPIAQRVLVSATNGEVFIARYHSFGKWTFEPTGFSYAYNKGSIIKWMPLPQVYTESGVEE